MPGETGDGDEDGFDGPNRTRVELSREVKRKLRGILRILDEDIKNCERFLQPIKKPDDVVEGMSSSEKLDYYLSITGSPFHNTMKGYMDAKEIIYGAFPELRP